MDGRISNFMQAASIRRYEMTEGKERGLCVLDCDNGKLRFLLNESKALDVMQLYHEGQNISFISKNGFTAREIPFAGRFEGGMVYTCGLDSVGGREGFELHGTLLAAFCARGARRMRAGHHGGSGDRGYRPVREKSAAS